MSQPTITTVMHTHAEDAVAYAKSRFRMDLDFSSQSLERVDRILAAMYYDIPRTFFAKLLRRGPTYDEVWTYSKMWGGYVGEVIRKRWGGTWKSSLKPDGHAQITFDVLGKKYHPVDAMHRRIVEGRLKGKGFGGAMELYEQIINELGDARLDGGATGAADVAPPLPRKMDPIPPSAPLLQRRQTVSDIVGLEPEDFAGDVGGSDDTATPADDHGPA